VFGYRIRNAVIRSLRRLPPAAQGRGAPGAGPARRAKAPRAPDRKCGPSVRCAHGVGLAALLWANALAASADRVDDYILAQMRWQHIPGLSLAVVQDGKILKAKGYGLANVETGTPAAPETVYKIGSVSKQFLAAGILLLVQEGRISLDDPIRSYL